MRNDDAAVWRPQMLIGPKTVAAPVRRPSWQPRDDRELREHLGAFHPHAVAILNEVSAKYGIGRAILLGRQQNEKVYTARAELYYRITMEMVWCQDQVGAFCKRDPSSVSHGIKRFRGRPPKCERSAA